MRDIETRNAKAREAQLLSPKDKERVEKIARAIYELDPWHESGEYVDGFLVSPGGYLSWEKALARDAEFADSDVMVPVTKFAFDGAKAGLKAAGWDLE